MKKRKLVACIPGITFHSFPVEWDEDDDSASVMNINDYFQYFEDIFTVEVNHIKSKYVVFDLFSSSIVGEDIEKFCNIFDQFIKNKKFENINTIEIRKGIR